MALFFKGLLLSQMSKTQAVLSKVFFTAIFPFRRAIVSTPFPALRFVKTKINAKTRGEQVKPCFQKKILSDNMLVVVTKMYWDWFFGDNPPRTFVSLRVPSIPPIGPIHGALPSISLGLAACQPWVHLDLNHRGWQLPQPLRVERCGFFGGAFFGWEIVAARSNKQTAKFGSFYCRYLHPHHVVFNIQKFWQFKTCSCQKLEEISSKSYNLGTHGRWKKVLCAIMAANRIQNICLCVS